MVHFKLVNFMVCESCLNKAAILEARGKTSVRRRRPPQHRAGGPAGGGGFLSKSWPTRDPVGRSPPGSSARGALRARTLGRGAISFPRGSSRPKD